MSMENLKFSIVQRNDVMNIEAIWVIGYDEE